MVSGNYGGGRGSQRCVVCVWIVSCQKKHKERELWMKLSSCCYLYSRPTRHTKRKQGAFRRNINLCRHPARFREIYGARHMCIAAAVYCFGCDGRAAATAEGTAAPAEREQSKQRRFETRLVAGHFPQTKRSLRRISSIDSKLEEFTTDVVEKIQKTLHRIIKFEKHM